MLVAPLGLLSACSMSGQITLPSSVSDFFEAPRHTPDAAPVETITTTEGTPGYQVSVSIGDISEKQTASGGWVFEGTFK